MINIGSVVEIVEGDSEAGDHRNMIGFKGRVVADYSDEDDDDIYHWGVDFIEFNDLKILNKTNQSLHDLDSIKLKTKSGWWFSKINLKEYIFDWDE